MNERVLWKGVLAGAIGGLIATAVKSVAEKLYPPRVHGEPEPPELLAEKMAGHRLDEDTKTVAAEAIHWGFGALAGAFYGALVEYYPNAAERDGAKFGEMLMDLTHEKALPAMGLSAEPDEQTEQEKSSEKETHVLYGVVTERVRGWVREALV